MSGFDRRLLINLVIALCVCFFFSNRSNVNKCTKFLTKVICECYDKGYECKRHYLFLANFKHELKIKTFKDKLMEMKATYYIYPTANKSYHLAQLEYVAPR